MIITDKTSTTILPKEPTTAQPGFLNTFVGDVFEVVREAAAVLIITDGGTMSFPGGVIVTPTNQTHAEWRASQGY